MKKLIAAVLCLVFVLCGCSQKAEPFYENAAEGVTLTPTYTYYFSDEPYMLCNWKNETEGDVRFHDAFAERLGSDGEWYLVKEKGNVEFNVDYCHLVEKGAESLARYDLESFAKKLDNGTTYRISTYYYDDNDNYYQVYAQFICDDEAAEKELSELSEKALEG